MAKTDHKSAVATAYASSLLQLANEQKTAEPIGQELRDLRQIVEQNPTFGLFLADPAIGNTERWDALNRIFTDKISPLMHNFLGVLNLKNRLGELSQISDAYDDLLDEQLGKIEVDVTVAQKLTPEQLEEVRQRVGTALKKEAVVHQYVDDSIIGGLVIRVQDKLIDASVKTQLAAMREQLLASRTK
jgi:F-type H+-transporting ATPase subunit delta